MPFYDVLDNPRLAKASCSEFEKNFIKENFPKDVIIRVFGFAGSGKGTLSSSLATILQIPNVESSFIFRGLTYLYLELGLESSFENSQKIFELLTCIPGESGELEVYYKDQKISKEVLKTPVIDQKVATYASVDYNRELYYDKLIVFLQLIQNSCILDGRGANTKYIKVMESLGRKIVRIFLDASDTVKAQRYYSARIAKLMLADSAFHEGEKERQLILEEFKSGIVKRNEQDFATWINLDMGVITPDTVILDTTEMTPEEANQTAIKYIGTKLGLI